MSNQGYLTNHTFIFIQTTKIKIVRISKTRMLTVIPLIVFICCSDKTDNIQYISDLQQQNLRGKVAKVETHEFVIGTIKNDSTLIRKTIEYFDKKGFTTKDISTSYPDNDTIENVLTFNSNGSMNSLTTVTNGQVESIMLLTYNKNGNCIIIKTMDSVGRLLYFDSLITQNIYGEIVRLNRYSSLNRLLYSFQNSYDSIYRIQGIARDSNNQIINVVNMSLNELNDYDTIEEITISGKIRDNKTTTYQYMSIDKFYNWTEMISYTSLGNVQNVTRRNIQYY